MAIHPGLVSEMAGPGEAGAEHDCPITNRY